MSFTASVYGDENLVVQSGFEIRKEHYDGEWNEDEWCYDPVTKEVSMEFENGTPHHELLIYTEAGGTFLISDFKVTQDVNAGDLRYTQAGTVTVESDVTSVRFTDLSNSDDCHYSYTVRALRDYQGTNYMSDHSDDVTVFLSESGIYGDAFARGEFSVSVEGLEVSVATDGVAALYAADGRMVARAKGYGRAVLTAPAAGMYIIAAPEGMRKVMVK